MRKSTAALLKTLAVLLVLLVVLSGCEKAEVPETEQNEKTENTVTTPAEPAGEPEPDEDSEEQDNPDEDVKTPEPDGETGEPDNTDEPAKPSTGGETTVPDNTSDELSEQQERIDELLSEVTELKSSFKSQLSSLEGQAANEYLDLDESERTDDKKSEIALKYYNEALGLESQCDSRIDSICAELQLLLIKTDGDKSIATNVRSEYNAEKEALKEDYMSVYGSYLG